MNHYYLREKTAARTQLNSAVDEFLNRGGEIQKIGLDDIKPSETQMKKIQGAFQKIRLEEPKKR